MAPPPSTTPRRFRPRLVPTLAALAGLAILLSLGTWQLGRYRDKLDLENQRAARADDAPLAVDSLDDLQPLGDHDLRTAQLQGRFEPQRQFLVRGRIHQGRPGYWLLTPFRLAGDDGLVLVHQGWLPHDAERPIEPRVKALSPHAPGTYTGQLRHLPRPIADEEARQQSSQDALTTWSTLDLTAMYGRLQGASADGALVVLDPLHQLGDEPIAGAGHISEGYLTPGTHLSYSMTWYALAAGLLALWLVGSVRREEG